MTDVGVSILGTVVLLLVVIVNAVFIATNPGPLVRGLMSLFPTQATATRSSARSSASGRRGWPGSAA